MTEKSNFTDAQNAARERIVENVQKLNIDQLRYVEGCIFGMIMNKEG